MGLADTAELSVRLSLDDKLSPGLRKVNGQLGKFESGAKRAGASIGRIGTAFAKAGLVAGGVVAVGLTAAIKSGIEDLATLETATTSVTGAIEQMGLTGKVTAGQVAGWANEIETAVGAAFDDKDITAATSTLIRYGKVTEKNIRPAMEVMTDLAAKTGSVESASSLLAKALADPAKAAGKLARVGVVLTKQQQKQIKAMMKSGDVAGAQALLLDALAKSTKGAAAASQGPYERAISVLTDVSEDARKALAEGFLPVIERVADKLSKVLADPKAIASIRSFGKSLANGFDDAVKFAEGVDWGAMAEGLKSAAGWAKRVVDAFASLPPEAKGMILALAGLTKLTGGAPIKIAVDFAKDALGGVFGHFFDRGASPANPLWVKTVGLPAGAGTDVPGVAGGGKSLIGKIVNTAGKLLIVGMVAEFADILKPAVVGLGQEIHQWLKLPDFKLPIPQEWPWGPKNTPTILPEIFGGNGLLGGTGADNTGSGAHTNFTGGRGGAPIVKAVNENKAATDRVGSKVLQSQGVIDRAIQQNRVSTHQKLSAVEAKQRESLVAFRAGERAINATKSSLGAKLGTANERLAQIRAKKMHFTTNVGVNVSTRVSVTEMQRQARYTSRVARTTRYAAS